jgi:thiamine biosynthesis lipoprotein ApbE
MDAEIMSTTTTAARAKKNAELHWSRSGAANLMVYSDGLWVRTENALT